jgi:hypothetical protein
MAYRVTGDQMLTFHRRVGELLRQLTRKDGSPIDPGELNELLQRVIEHRPADDLRLVSDKIPIAIDPNMDLLDLSRRLRGQELGALNALKNHPWVSCLADCALAAEHELEDVKDLGRVRLEVLKQLLNRAGVTLAPADADRSGWIKFDGWIYPPDKFRAITLERAGRGLNEWHVYNGMSRVESYADDWEKLAECGLRTFRDVLMISDAEIRAKIREKYPLIVDQLSRKVQAIRLYRGYVE